MFSDYFFLRMIANSDDDNTFVDNVVNSASFDELGVSFI